MAENFNLKGEAARKLLICAVDVSDGTGIAEWEIQGYKTEDASIELTPDVTTLTDVLGNTYSNVNKFAESITFEPNTLKMGDKLNKLMIQYWRDGDLEKFSQFKALIGYGFIGEDGEHAADIYTESTITPNRIGGSSRVGMPFTINFGGEKIKGTIDKLQNGLVFTPEA